MVRVILVILLSSSSTFSSIPYNFPVLSSLLSTLLGKSANTTKREHKTTHYQMQLSNPHYPKGTTITPNLGSLLHFHPTFHFIIG
ncbi:hypothetical protein F5H01DRAFT_65288 [Linnemannia elongata]|nr:hypothetical protein F5H01DRAFT_65288 [Linnemannia elongata]